MKKGLKITLVVGILVFLLAGIPLLIAGVREGIIPLYKWGLGIPQSTQQAQESDDAAPVVSDDAAPVVSDDAAAAEIKGKILVDGEEVGNDLGNRLTITCGQILFPGIEPADYTPAQIEKIETTWVKFDIKANSMLPMVFGTDLKIDNQEYNGGIAAYIGSIDRTIEIKNGELVLWLSMDDLSDDIQTRMSKEILEGNVNFHKKLAFKICSPEVAGYFPSELLENNNVEIIDFNN